MNSRLLITSLLSLTVLFATPVLQAKKLYKTVDESGKTYFSDQIKPEEAKHRHETLNKEGRVLEVTEKELSPEQKEHQAYLDMLRKKQEKIIQTQKAKDESLLRSYHSKEEIENELKERLRTIEGQKQLLDDQLAQRLSRLDAAEKRAAGYERNNQTVPKTVLDEIETIKQDIKKAQANIDTNLALQQKTTDDYQASIKRFLSLTESDSSTSSTQSNKISSIEEADTLGLFHCENDFQCKKAWEVARTFVDTHSTTPPDIVSDELVMHALPTKDVDFSLSISKISSGQSSNLLFLDIHCHNSQTGNEMCASKKIQDLRSAFRPYVNERLSKLSTP